MLEVMLVTSSADTCSLNVTTILFAVIFSYASYTVNAFPAFDTTPQPAPQCQISQSRSVTPAAIAGVRRNAFRLWSDANRSPRKLTQPILHCAPTLAEASSRSCGSTFASHSLLGSRLDENRPVVSSRCSKKPDNP